MKLYWFYRKERIGTKSLWEISLNGWYSISFYANEQYQDWISAWLISIKDMEIPTERYTKELVPWIKDLREFVYLEYNPEYVELELAKTIINKIWARFDLELLGIEQAKKFIREHTDLKEVEEWKFLINEAYEWEEWLIEAKYLIIE